MNPFDEIKKYEKELLKDGIILETEPYEGNQDVLFISIIEVPDSMRGTGVGKKVFKKLCEWADKHGKIMTLGPAGSHKNSRKFLIEWYSQFGFIENKGKNDRDDLKYMYRLPKGVNESFDENSVNKFEEYINSGDFCIGERLPSFNEFEEMTTDVNKSFNNLI